MEKPNKEFYSLLYSLLLVANKVANKSLVGQRINFQVGVGGFEIDAKSGSLRTQLATAYLTTRKSPLVPLYKRGSA